MILVILMFILVIFVPLVLDGRSSDAMEEYCSLECWDTKITKVWHCC